MNSLRKPYVVLALLFTVALGNSAPLGAAEHKVAICHKDRNTLEVDFHAVPAHLAHGDSIGACTDNQPE